MPLAAHAARCAYVPLRCIITLTDRDRPDCGYCLRIIAVLSPYNLGTKGEFHALREQRSILHVFASLGAE
ncbi:hypothetical protein PUR_26470 [Paenibacillus sp. URB8-2]|nr:hypothetical protein PUR_26470 [Paenibacillus sp. URB8-2]